MKSIVYKVLLLLAALIGWRTGKSENLQSDNNCFTLQKCLEYASEHSATLRKQQAQTKSAKMDKVAAVGNFLPSLSASSTAEYEHGRVTDPETNSYIDADYFSNSYNISLNLPLFTGFVNVNNLRMAKSVQREYIYNEKAVADKISLEVITAFYNVIYYRGLVEQVSSQLDESRQNLYQSQRMEQLGMKSGADIAQLEATVATNEYTLIKQENLLENARVELKAAMNFDIDQEILLDDSLEPLEAIPTMENPDSLFARATNYLPSSLAAMNALKGSKYSYYKSIGAFMPKLNFFAAYYTSFSKDLASDAVTVNFADQLRNKAQQVVGVSVSVPIFTGLSNYTSLKKAKYERVRQQAEYNEVMNDLHRDITQSILDLNGACRQYIQTVKKVNATEIAHRVNKRKFEEGMISALELQNSANQLLEAKAEQVGIHVKYLVCKKQVDYFNGIPFIK